MSKISMDEYIVAAEKAIDEKSKSIQINDRLRSKAASFGPDINQLGLKTAVTAYSNNKKSESKQITELVYETLKRVPKEVLPEPPKENEKDLQAYVKNHSDFQAKRRILKASVAVKLVLRTWPDAPAKKDEEKDQGNEQGGEETSEEVLPELSELCEVIVKDVNEKSDNLTEKTIQKDVELVNRIRMDTTANKDEKKGQGGEE